MAQHRLQLGPFKKKKIIDLKDRVTKRGSVRDCPSAGPLPQMATVARVRPGQRQEAGIPSRSPILVAGAQALGLSFVPFLDTSTGNWMGSKGIEQVLIWDIRVGACCATVLDPAMPL